MSSERITFHHGAGGKYMMSFINDFILKHFSEFKNKEIEIPLEFLEDSSVISGIAFTTDSYTVYPIFFPGGDIGKLAVAGTINDLSVKGAKVLALSFAMVLEEGITFEDIDKIIKSAKETAFEAKVPIITGDTKVVEKGNVNKMIINTSGIGIRSEELKRNFEILKEYKRNVSSKWLTYKNIRAGDLIIINGNIGDHALAILSARKEIETESEIKSDVAPLNGLIQEALKIGGITCAKDPTRGGIAALLNEWSNKTGLGFIIYENKVPIGEAKVITELLGIDIFEVGNEGKVLMTVIPELAEDVLKQIRKHKYGKNAEIIGKVTDEFNNVVLETTIGGKRYIPTPIGDPVPRIC